MAQVMTGLRSALRERCVSILTPSSLRCSK